MVEKEEARLLDPQQSFTQFPLDSFLHQPFVRLNSAILAPVEIGDEEPPIAKGAASQIQQGVVLPEPKRREKAKGHGRDQVVILRRPNISAIVWIARLQPETEAFLFPQHRFLIRINHFLSRKARLAGRPQARFPRDPFP